jgi:hypothetical protein
LFAGRRRYADSKALPWYILSAKFGLLAPGDVIGPYDVYLADQSPAYRRAWGEFVIAQLEQKQPHLHGSTVEVHAGAAYTDPLRAPLAERGATLATPLAHLRQGEQLAWYSSRPHLDRSATPTSAAVEPGGRIAELVGSLTEPARALSPPDLMRNGPAGLQVPGMYSWWVDDRGAADLSRGLGQPVPAGLIYAGQAGATRWPGGRRSHGTLWSRITDMHLNGPAEFSTFRRTLAAILRPVLGMTSEDDPQLSAWINAHLRVNAVPVPVPDADKLGEAEAIVLDAIDPPLNLQGRRPSPIRTHLTQLRRHRSRGAQTK